MYTVLRLGLVKQKKKKSQTVKMMPRVGSGVPSLSPLQLPMYKLRLLLMCPLMAKERFGEATEDGTA